GSVVKATNDRQSLAPCSFHTRSTASRGSKLIAASCTTPIQGLGAGEPCRRYARPSTGGRMTCTNCGTENKPGRKFCANCGVALSTSCPACGAANDPTDRFCGECGTPLATGVAPDERAAPVAERRLVSVLFMDLVGFTAASESRNAEDVRDLLSRYFDVARTVVGRYGGTIEKFIGDAVMAVWGTPITREDDAERAVRSALELVAAIPALGAEAGVDGLAARAGVATDETAVTLDAEGQGMVAVDIVNTASRVQSAAPPGGVFVTDATRHPTDAAIA